MYELEVETSRGKTSRPFRLEKRDAPRGCTGLNPTITAVVPARGFVNAKTTLAIVGSNFVVKANNDRVKQVIVGGRLAENLQVIGDTLIQVEVPAWSNGKTPSPYTNAATAAEVVVVSNCGWDKRNAVYFDIVVPGAPDAPKSELDKQVEVLKSLEALNHPRQFSGSVRLEVGSSNTRSNAPAASSSTVIIQNGQNTNATK